MVQSSVLVAAPLAVPATPSGADLYFGIYGNFEFLRAVVSEGSDLTGEGARITAIVYAGIRGAKALLANILIEAAGAASGQDI